VSTSTDFEIAQGFAFRKRKKPDSCVHMMEIYLTEKNSPQMSIVPPKPRYKQEKEVMLLPNFQFITLMVRIVQRGTKEDPEKFIHHRIITTVELPYQDNLSKISQVETSLVIWFDLSSNEDELELFE